MWRLSLAFFASAVSTIDLAECKSSRSLPLGGIRRTIFQHARDKIDGGASLKFWKDWRHANEMIEYAGILLIPTNIDISDERRLF